MKRVLGGILMIAFAMLLGGCGFWMDGEYLSVKPHVEPDLMPAYEVIHVDSCDHLIEQMENLVESGADGGMISLTPFDAATALYYINTAGKYVTQNNPIGAYAVDDITYEIGTNAGLPIVLFHISYRHERTEILRMEEVNGVDEASELIYAALDACDTSVVIKVNNYTDRDYSQLVQDYADRNPNRVMEVPQVKHNVYPDIGNVRILELNFTYQTNREQLRIMQKQVETVFTSAELYVKESDDVLSIYSRLYTFLMERDQYTLETSITPAYSLLHHGVGDSRAFANVYAAMCRRSGLDCRVVMGTKDGNPHCWNLIRYRGKYHHVDLLSSHMVGQFQMFPDQAMVGYVWDYSMYPEAE